jgi:type 1 glutamine amidotransferase
MKRFLAHSCLFVVLLHLGIAHPRGHQRTTGNEPGFSVLVFSKTSGFRHDSIPDGIAAIEQLGAEHNFSVVATEDDAQFTDDTLANFSVVIFLNTTGTVLDDAEKAAFMRYIESGGGFVGIHSATDTEYEWPWYGQLVGAYFQNHPSIQQATVDVVDQQHPSTVDLPALWVRTDEWYNFQTNPRGSVHVLAVLDETTYDGGTMGSDHPISWCQEFDNGRSWYTAMGHTRQTYSEPLYQNHILGGIRYAAGVAAGNCDPNAP